MQVQTLPPLQLPTEVTMPAMHDEVRDLMVSNLEEKCKLMLRLKPFSMTHEECLRLVTPRHHVDLLLEASKIANACGGR